MYRAVCEARAVEAIDYELSNPAADIAALRAVSAANGIALVLSYHNFEATPDAATLDGKFAEAARLGADVAKVAVMPRCPRDVLDLLAATDRARATLDLPLISMSMGGIGSLSRLVGWQFGSATTFAVGKSSSAPGQIGLEELRTALGIIGRAVGRG